MSGILLAFIGIGLMLGLSGCGSAVGTSIAGMSALGALRKRPESFTSYVVLTALPGTQGLYGIAGFFILQTKLAESLTLFQGSAILGAGFLVGIVGLVSAIYQGKVVAHAITSVGAGQDEALAKGLILGSFPELYAILSLACLFLISGVI